MLDCPAFAVNPNMVRTFLPYTQWSLTCIINIKASAQITYLNHLLSPRLFLYTSTNLWVPSSKSQPLLLFLLSYLSCSSYTSPLFMLRLCSIIRQHCLCQQGSIVPLLGPCMLRDHLWSARTVHALNIIIAGCIICPAIFFGAASTFLIFKAAFTFTILSLQHCHCSRIPCM